MKHYDAESHLILLAVFMTFIVTYVLLAKAFEASREVEATKIERKK